MAATGSAPVPSRKRIWSLLLFGCLAGLSTYLFTPLEQPDQLFLASDVYRHTASSWLAGGEVYGVHPPDRPGYAFLYPPIALLVFLPHAIVGSSLAAFSIQTLLNIGAAIGTAVVLYRGLARREVAVTRADLGILTAFMLLSSYSAIQFMNGQINLWLALAIALGFDAIDRERQTIAGVAFAVAALFKVFPAILGLWLLRLRAWKAVAAAIATGLGGLVLGAVLLGPELTMTYFTDVLIGRFEGSTYEGQPTPEDNVDGMHRQLAVLWPAGQVYHTLIALVVLGPLVAISLRETSSPLQRDVAGLAVLIGILLFLPLQPLYFPLIVFPVCMLLYTLSPGYERWLLVGGTLLTFLHLDQESILLGLDLVPVPEALAAPLLSVTEVFFTLILPPTLGLWILLFACVLIQLPTPAFVDRQSSPTVA